MRQVPKKYSPMTVPDFYLKKQASEKIAMITCYDHWSAQIIAQTDVDCVLVGDSVAMVMHGYPNTVPATTEMMVFHTQAVARGAANKFIIADMPFLAHRKGLRSTMNAVQALMQAGAQAIKIERAEGNLKLIAHIVASGVPVIGHLGMTPQSVHQMGGFQAQGKSADAEEILIKHAAQLEEAGCFALVLECIPAALAKTITNELNIPTIGIGAGPDVDGQVLVLQDMLGMNPVFKPKFLKTYLDGFTLIQSALNEFAGEVKAKKFPRKEHCY